MTIEKIVLKNNFILLLLIILSLLSSCSQKVVFEDRNVFDSQNWDKSEIISFNPMMDDTTKTLSMGITFKHGSDYPYSNLWLFVSVENDFGVMIRDTVELFVAQPNGKWIGKKYGSGYEVTAFYKQRMKVAKPEQYKFSFGQGMREDILEDVRSLEFWIVED